MCWRGRRRGPEAYPQNKQGHVAHTGSEVASSVQLLLVKVAGHVLVAWDGPCAEPLRVPPLALHNHVHGEAPQLT